MVVVREEKGRRVVVVRVEGGGGEARASGVAASADGDARGGGWRRHVAGDALLVAGSFDARVRDRVRLERPLGRPETAPLSRPARFRRRGGGLANDVPGGGWRGRGVDGAGEGRRRGSTRRRRGWVSRRARVEHRAGRAPARPLRRRPERGVVLARELAEVGVSRGGDGGAARRRRARDELRRHRRRASMCAARAARRKPTRREGGGVWEGPKPPCTSPAGAKRSVWWLCSPQKLRCLLFIALIRVFSKFRTPACPSERIARRRVTRSGGRTRARTA